MKTCSINVITNSNYLDDFGKGYTFYWDGSRRLAHGLLLCLLALGLTPCGTRKLWIMNALVWDVFNECLENEWF